MKKTTPFIKIICFFLIFCVVAAPVAAETEPSQPESTAPIQQGVYGCYSADATDAFLGSDQMIKNAKSAFLYELNTKTLMYTLEPDLQLPPSSFVKILTAIVAIENGDLNSAVTVTQAVLDTLPSNAMSVDLLANEVLTLKDLLYCMLVGSANDAAAVIAQYIGGGQDLFADRMNDMAARLGCTGSNFVNAHGLHHEQQYTTARDVAKILEYAMKNEAFREIFTAEEYTVPASNKSVERDLVTGNYMMSTAEVEIYYDERVLGGRTGVANDGSRCLATVAGAGGMELLCVVMGAASVYEEGGNRISSFGGYNETKTLLDNGFTGYMASQILYDGQALIQRDVTNGDSLLTLGPKTTLSTVLPIDLDLSDLSFRYDNDSQLLEAPVSAGDRICSVEVWYKDLCLVVTDLYALNDVRRGSAFLQEEAKQNSSWVLGVVIALVLVCVLTVLLLRHRIAKAVKIRIRRRRRAQIMKRRRDH